MVTGKGINSSRTVLSGRLLKQIVVVLFLPTIIPANSMKLSQSRSFFLRKTVIALLGTTSFRASASTFTPDQTSAFTFSQSISSSNSDQLAGSKVSENIIAFRDLSLNIPSYDTSVPVATWWKPDTSDVTNLKRARPTYSHRISVKKIGSILAGLNFIPEFVSKDYRLSPSLTKGDVVEDMNLSIPSKRPVIILAHGFLGSRFDLSHIAEELALQGFICVSPEYPESLAASYTQKEGLDRSIITERLLELLTKELKIAPTKYGIIGHSLGTGTVMTTGDDSWTRVCLAGNIILLCSYVLLDAQLVG